MCYHSKQTKKAAELESRFNAKIDNSDIFTTSEHYTGHAYPYTPVISNDNRKLIQQFKWGLIPENSRDVSIREYTLNARIETLQEKPSFKNSIGNRCLIIVDGFYEWKWLTESGNKKEKYLITLPDDGLFAFAGLYSGWTDKSTGEIIKTYTIVTTEAVGIMEEIHNSKKRMPVILDTKNENDWLAGREIEDFKICNIALKGTTLNPPKHELTLF